MSTANRDKILADLANSDLGDIQKQAASGDVNRVPQIVNTLGEVFAQAGAKSKTGNYNIIFSKS